MRSNDTFDGVILPGLSILQVVCAEDTDPDHPEERSKLSIFAVGEDGGLYYVQGSRDYTVMPSKVTFEASGLPIRTGITHMSTRFNVQRASSELLFCTKEDNVLHYLRRSPNGTTWMEDLITRKGYRMIKYDAYMTTLTLSDGCGLPVREGSEVKIAGEPLHIVANGKSYCLSKDSITLTTDAAGSITIVIPSARKLGCPSIAASFCGFEFTITPGDRVERLMKNLRDESSMRDARSGAGEKLFADIPSDKLQEVSSMFSKMDDVKKQLKTGVSKQDMDIEAQTSEEGKGWFLDAVDSTEAFLGDCIEAVKRCVKSIVKFAIRIVGPVVKMVFKIGGKIFSFVVKGLDYLLTGLGNFLENYLGIDILNKFLKYFKALLDPKVIAKTQQVCCTGFRFIEVAWTDLQFRCSRKLSMVTSILLTDSWTRIAKASPIFSTMQKIC